MRIIVNSLLKSTTAIANVGIVLISVWFMFAILGVSLFKGKFYSCSNETWTTKELCTGNGYEWENADSNFDNVYEAMVTLFIISTLEGWPDIMYQGVDAT